MRVNTCIMMMAMCVISAPAGADEEFSDPMVALAPVNDEILLAARGTGGVMNIDYMQLGSVDSSAQLNGNLAHSTVSGDNSISNGVFSSASGFATVIQNSGNNVIIQNSTIINFSLQ